MPSKRMRALALVPLLAGSASAAGSYDLLPFEELTSDHRVLIGIPHDSLTDDLSARVRHRREAIMKAVDGHLERAAEAADSVALESVQYAYVSEMEAAFPDLFPKHTKAGALEAGLDEKIATPALKLINVATKEIMYPDWPILLADLPEELDRLVRDYERWQQQTEAAAKDPADGVLQLHGKNFVPTAGGAFGLVSLFYAPWCHYSQLMLPKFAEAAALVGRLEGEGILPRGRVALAKVNVDEEGELRNDYNVTTYPQLRSVRGGAPARQAAKAAKAAQRRAVLPARDFGGQTATGADIAAHAVSTFGWASGRAFATLQEAGGEATAAAGKKDDSAAAGKDTAAAGKKTDSAARFAGLANAVDVALKDAHAAAQLLPPPEEGEPSRGEAARAAVFLCAFGGEGAASSPAARRAAAEAVASLVGGAHVFVASGGEAEAAEAARLLFDAAPPALAGSGSDGADDAAALASQAQEAGAAAAAAVAAAAALAGAGARRGGELVAGGESGGGGGGAFLGGLVALRAGQAPLVVAPLPAALAEATGKASAEALAPRAFLTKARAAASPLASRFSTSAEQGARIQASGVSTLCVLAGDEGDFMFEGFVEALREAAAERLGAAHFLFADAATEPRIGGLLRAAGAESPAGPGAEPVLVLISMAREFSPRKLQGGKITARAIVSLLDDAAAEAAHAAASSAGGEL